MTLKKHLHELRNRFFVIAAILLIGMVLGTVFHRNLAQAVVAPLNGQHLIYLNPSGGFDFVFKIALVFGVLLALPAAAYNVYRFIAPLISKAGKRMAFLVTVGSSALALSGALFGYFVAVPNALQFLTNFASDYVQSSLTADSYLGFVTLYILGLAALFQLPLILILINKIKGPLSKQKLWKSQRFVLIGAFVAAAIITPTPDISNQVLLATPIIAVYQIGVVGVLWQNWRTKLSSAVKL